MSEKTSDFTCAVLSFLIYLKKKKGMKNIHMKLKTDDFRGVLCVASCKFSTRGSSGWLWEAIKGLRMSAEGHLNLTAPKRTAQTVDIFAGGSLHKIAMNSKMSA